MALSTQRSPSSSSSSSSSSTTPSTYDVFLSFCGEDTRNGFTDHLYGALKQRGFVIFKDDKKLQQGKDISQELLTAIRKSQYAIVIISKNFAYSSWCLRELMQIIERMREGRLTVLPVFYHVDPSDIRKQKGSFEKAFNKHKDNLEINKKQMKSQGSNLKEVVDCVVDPYVTRKYEMHFVKASTQNVDNLGFDEDLLNSWKATLKEVGNLSGWHVHDRPESIIIEEISAKISWGLNSNLSCDFEEVVGIEPRVQEVMKLLHIGEDVVRMVGIYGMAGIGKTTLANFIYERVSPYYESSCFITSVREESSKQGLAYLQKQLVMKILKEKDIDIFNTFDGVRVLKRRLRNIKAFIVLDDVDEKEQLENLAGRPEWFGHGSRIIITSRDTKLLAEYVDASYEVPELNHVEALPLFSWKAFKKPHPKESYTKLSMEFVYYAQGLPLALEILGSFLVNRVEDEWKSALDQLKTAPKAKILNKLKISFDGLEDLQKQLFLDVACFYNGWNKATIFSILESCGYYPKINLQVLSEKSLIKISWDGKLWMHDLLVQMGQQIVCHESPRDPGKRSRLWHVDDVIHVLNNKFGTNAVEQIVLEYPSRKHQRLSLEGFSKLKMLRLLVIRQREVCLHDKVADSLDVLEWQGCHSKLMLSSKLSVLDWWRYPLQSLPENFQPDNLILLRMPFSYNKQLWRGRKSFEKLRYIDVCHSQCLMETPDLSGVPNVKELSLSFCTSLSKVCSSIENLKQLEYLRLQGCESLEKLPKEICLESLKIFDLFGCLRLKEFPETLGNMISLQGLGLGGTAIEKLPSSFMTLSSLQCLDISGWCSSMSVELWEEKAVSVMGGSPLNMDPYPRKFSFSNWSIGLESLTHLNLSYLNLADGALPRDISYLSSLEFLDISENRFTKIPECVCQLSYLTMLSMRSCRSLQSLSVPIPSRLSFLSYPTKLLIASMDCNLPDGAIPLRLRSLNVQNCQSLEIYDCHTDDLTHSSETELWPSVWFSVASNNGYSATPYKIVQLLAGCPLLRDQWRSHVAIPWGPTLGCEIPRWFNQRSTSCFGAIHSRVDLDLGNWRGYALFVIYEVHGHENSSFGILGRSNPTFPMFVCRAQADGISLERPGVLYVPEIPSVGRNGFWVYLPVKMFREWRTDLAPSHYLGVSIATGSLNVEIKECGGRLIHEYDVSDLFEVLGSITPPGLELKELEEFELYLRCY